MTTVIRAPARRWWAAIRATGRLRLTYEIALALVLAGTAALFGATSETVLPTAVVVPVAVLAALICTPLRLVYPLSTLVAAALAGVVTGDGGGGLLFVLSVSAGYRMRHLGRTLLAFLVTFALWQLALLQSPEMRDVTGQVLGAAGFVWFFLFPAAAGWAVGKRRRVVRAMHWRNVQLHDQQEEVARQARTRERTRIARDLHDSLGHQLTLISLYAGTLNSATGPQRDETITLLRTTAASAMADLRQSLGILRQDGDADEVGAAQPLSNLDGLADAARSAGASSTLTRSGTERPLPPLIEHAAYRVIQEGMTNALRHARGGSIEVSLRYEPDTLVVEVLNGPGAPHGAPTSGQGLIGLGERVRLAGGVLYHGATPDRGFRLAAMLPYQVPASEGGAGPDQLAVPGPVPGTDVAGDFELLVRRSARRSRIALIALTGTVVAVLGICVAAVVVIATLPDTSVDPERFDALRIGASEPEVRKALPDPGSAVTGDPAPPPDTTCVDYSASLQAQLESDSERELIYRFCFRDGALVTKEKLYR
ncbi:sensor histidine kinase [Jidongwangia harbinensis]|uniref:sensor histidine kinase n=1 Tax=Jidongwangia harbinensis TaxID=2878561 RepID=UPI001CDA169B|nr:sensor histidine kinase [Jidongwangia harbinensis]MCA2217369.1 sensor histidine kinase [Jidongwangia harbinensis]